MAVRLRPFSLLALLWLMYFHPLVLHPAHTLYAPYSDFLAEHLPAKLFLNHEWTSRGELPLWDPYHFCGTPFVHDIQVGAFYPPNAVVYLVPEHAIGAALSWVIALHVLAAGVFAFIYARARGLNEVGGLVAAVGFMLSSKWMTHLLLAGHTITIGLAWLPLVLLTVERGIANRSAWGVCGAGCALALLGLGTHPQWAFYAGVFAVAWTVPERARFVRFAACWAGAVAVAGLLAAVQLLPTWEAAQWSARSGTVEATGALTLGPRTALALLGPSLSYSAPQTWETQGVFGLFWLTAAVAAPALVGGRARWRFGVLCGLVAFSIGGAALLEPLPGFGWFRVPTRMLLIAAFPLAFLAGVTTDALARAAWALDARAALAAGFRRVAIVIGVPTIIGLWFASGATWWAFVAYWAAVVVALVPFVRVLQNQTSSVRTRTLLWLGVLLVDLIAPIAVLPAVRRQTDLYPSSPAMDALAACPEPRRVLDWDTGGENGQASFLGIGAPHALVHRVATPRGYNPLDVRHYREFLAFVVDDPQPVRGNSPYTQQVVPNFEVGNPELFRLLCVTHRVVPDEAQPLPGAWNRLLVDPAPPAPPPLLPLSPDPLPPHTLSEAANPHARTWIVPRAERLTGNHLEGLKQADLANTVLISNESALSHPHGDKPGAARVIEYQANRVTVELDGTAGWLVLSDVWFPGWTCRVDGVEVPVERANHAFRAVPVSAGAKRAEFTFAPQSYRIGWWASACTVLALIIATGICRLRRGLL
ncbi:YfhO family protein [Frigoriglobus tundricola]|uniref:Membrane protein 6-pyruvoyl-tetrahydropterin synthase-related domain-containing protein n=1 Tax=Frigoriglobus tundricola TaxID=2774151 RepID=A0A6M5YIC7_9BACT|nr:YfhO family protein [Frigoriglobus tundricola]QJW93839.1 hypothetical protein FTUN_1351 [Frigoriglobus tundricola]